jgi:hypothetical protein
MLRAKELSPYGFFIKPVDERMLMKTIELHLSR